MIKILRSIKTVLMFSIGLIYYKVRGINLERTYFDFLQMFLVSNGRSNDFLAKVISVFSVFKKMDFVRSHSSFQNSLEAKQEKIIDDLQIKGYSIFESKIRGDIVNSLQVFSRKSVFKRRKPDNKLAIGEGFEKLVNFDEERATAVAFDADLKHLINEPVVQNLLVDPYILNVVQKYFDAPPLIDYPAMWWLSDSATEADNEAAQTFHFDLERIKWVKIFIYLSEVTLDDGPHCFVPGTHLAGSLPTEIRRRGYSRLKDYEVDKFFPKESWIEFTGSPGTIFIENTRGLHRGGVAKKGHSRLLLQLQFCNSLFASNLKKIPMPDNPTPFFLEQLKVNPLLFRGFDAKN